MRQWVTCFFGLILAAASSHAQSSVQQFQAELAAPFGSILGHLVLAGDQLLFLDDSQPDSSFYVARSNVKDIATEGDVVTLQLNNAVRDRSGERTRMSFRVTGERVGPSMAAWRNAQGPMGQNQPAAASGGDSQAVSYQARHKKLLGGSRGRLLVSNTGLAYESIDDANDSRRWDFSQIQQLKQKGPYELRIEPFNGDAYTLGLEGKGMDSSDFSQIVDRVTRARATKTR